MTGNNWWFEIASVEHPTLLRAALEEAEKLEVPIKRVSMGSGVQLLTDAELDEYLDMAHAASVEVYTYQSLRGSFEPTPDRAAGQSLRGEELFAEAVEELRFCAQRGVDGVLVSDIGLLSVAGKLRQTGEIGGLGLKSAVAIAPHNAEAAGVLADLGATSINVGSTASRETLLPMRSRIGSDVSIDLYVEAPDDLGGGLRYRDVSFLIKELTPLYLKLGLRGAQSLYPYGQHLHPYAEQTIREKVRRGRLALDAIKRSAS